MVISLGVYSIFRHTHMVNNHGKTTNNGWFSQKNTSWERGWSGRHRGQLGQTRHQSRTLKCCFATKTRFWNMNLPEKMGLLICFICFIELCFIICIYIYMFFTKQIQVCTTKHTSSQIWTRFTVPSQQPLHQQSSAGCPRTKRLPGVDFCQSLGVMALIYIVQLMSDVISNLDISNIMNNYIGYKLI